MTPVRRCASRRSATIAIAALLSFAAFGLAGCGDTPSDEQVNAAKPALAIPNEPVTPGEASDSEPTGSTGATGDSGDTSGGDTGTDTGGTTPQDTGGADTGGNDTGGGQNTGGGQQFDQFCQENPGACGD
jgi:hypothetical protein